MTSVVRKNRAKKEKYHNIFCDANKFTHFAKKYKYQNEGNIMSETLQFYDTKIKNIITGMAESVKKGHCITETSQVWARGSFFSCFLKVGEGAKAPLAPQFCQP